MRILVTGAAGAVGSALVPELERLGHRVVATDVESMDVRWAAHVVSAVTRTQPDAIVHLAASKLAVEGELHPEGFVNVNVRGTFNVVTAAKACGAKLIFASTCKAADPETVYGACKLIAERAVMSAGGTALRFFNILECGPSVATIWEQIPEDEPIPFTDCLRYFITVEQAVGLVVASLELRPGRLAVDPGKPVHMRDVARRLYPGRALVEIPRRRGDRQAEPLHAASEWVVRSGSLMRIHGPHDPETADVQVVAA